MTFLAWAGLEFQDAFVQGTLALLGALPDAAGGGVPLARWWHCGPLLSSEHSNQHPVYSVINSMNSPQLYPALQPASWVT